MGYCFRIYEKDKNSYIPYIPNNFREEDANELVYFDYITCLMGNIQTFAYKFKKDKDIHRNLDIEKITIGLREANAHYAYKTVFKNPYIEALLEVKDKTFVNIKGNEDSENEIDKMTINPDSMPFREMKKFLFTFIQDKEKSEIFFKKVYKNKNSFRELLSRYSITYLSNDGTNEDMQELLRLDSEIKENLKKYRYFRTLATSRFEYELKYSEELEEIEEKDEITDVDEYNQEYDEYLDEKEYSKMAGEGNKVLISRRK